jgi:hypothetical protein
MASADRFFIGPNLAGKLREVITRVGGMPDGSGDDGNQPLPRTMLPVGNVHYLCKTSGAWTKGTSATLTIYAGTPGSETSTSDSVGAYNKFSDVAADKWVMVGRANGGWYLIAAECQ